MYDLETIIEFSDYADEQETRTKIWQKWLTVYPYMDKQTFKPFEEYYKEHFVKVKSTAQINRDAERIIAKFKAGEKDETDI